MNQAVGYTSFGKDGRVRSVVTTIVDLPLRRPHRHAGKDSDAQSFLIVELQTEGGIVGIGEGVTPGGPWWGGDSIETMKIIVDNFLAPAIIGIDVFDIHAARAAMDRAAARQNFAKAAIDMALHDAAARMVGVPVSHLLGGQRRDRIPVLLALGSGDPAQDVEEARNALALGRHNRFKLKMGARAPAKDVEKAIATIEAIGPASFSVDINQAWDEPTAMKWAPELERAGVDLFEQPLRRTNLHGMRRLAERLDAAVMADESVWDAPEALAVIRHGAADVIAVKVAKGGGLRGAAAVASIADAADVTVFGGTTIETSIGTAASMQLFAGLPSLPMGCELFGPLLLADDLVEEPVKYRDFCIEMPTGIGLGVTIDRDKFQKYSRG